MDGPEKTNIGLISLFDMYGLIICYEQNARGYAKYQVVLPNTWYVHFTDHTLPNH